MALSNQYQVFAAYVQSQVVRDRNYAGLAAWSAAQLAQTVPANPTDSFIRLLLMAQRVPQTPDNYVQRIAPYMLQQSNIQANICKHVAPFLEDADDQAVAQQISDALATVMPQIAAIDIAQGQVDQWKAAHGIPATRSATT
jgi:hypothetical protein